VQNAVGSRRSPASAVLTALLFAAASPVQAQTAGPQFINPPGLARPELLLEIEAVVDLPSGRGALAIRWRLGGPFERREPLV
jgi:hypothetical protein